MFDDISDDPEMRAAVDQASKERNHGKLEAFVSLEDILAFMAPIKVLGLNVDAIVNAVVVQTGTDKLYVEDLDVIGWKIFVEGVERSMNSLDEDFELTLMRQLKDIARDLAARTEEKYWDYRRYE